MVSIKIEGEIIATANNVSERRFDWQTAMDKLATMPRQAEWEAFVAKLQGCRADARSDEKWQMMEKMFYLYE